jgi:hypothetical protein
MLRNVPRACIWIPRFEMSCCARLKFRAQKLSARSTRSILEATTTARRLHRLCCFLNRWEMVPTSIRPVYFANEFQLATAGRSVLAGEAPVHGDEPGQSPEQCMARSYTAPTLEQSHVTTAECVGRCSCVWEQSASSEEPGGQQLGRAPGGLYGCQSVREQATYVAVYCPSNYDVVSVDMTSGCEARAHRVTATSSTPWRQEMAFFCLLLIY